MTIRRFRTNPRMSMAVSYNGVVYLAGQVAKDPVPSVADQTRQILKSIDDLLQEAGTDKSRLLTANIWLVDMATFDEMNAVWDAWVSQGNTPARATVGAKLAKESLLVEIAVTAGVS
jgi:enamine deaminase RidA (YjgF/YER057c/UK114 family)